MTTEMQFLSAYNNGVIITQLNGTYFTDLGRMEG